MWILNVTPDSFSDGGHWNAKGSSGLAHTINLLNPEVILDVGAESTAPQNTAITDSEEMRRLNEIFFPALEKVQRPVRLSFDTYKPEVMSWIISKLKSIFKDKYNEFVTELIWNDVSGCVDELVIKILQTESKLKYIACHNKIPSRLNVLKHMEYIDVKADIVKDVLNFFTRVKNIFNEHGLAKRVILDPAFGFAKTREQNWFLIDNLSILLSPNLNTEHLIGVSRKSFLRDHGKKISDEGQLVKTEKSETEILKKVNSLDEKYNIIFRTHSENIINFLQKK